MSWSHCGTDSKGRPLGYAVRATCDHEDCHAEIDRGLNFACGGMHGKTEFGCEQYFCDTHLEFTVEHDDSFDRICESCTMQLTTSGEWALHPEDWVIRRITRP